MKIGVISDTHIPINASEISNKIKKYFKGVDMILHAGDLVELSVMEELKKLTNRVEAVYGNMDSSETRATLPEKKTIKAGKYRIGLTHGSGAPESLVERIAKEFKDVDIIVFGHSHIAMNKKINGVLFFNPGSATDVVFAKERTIGLLELNDDIRGEIIAI